MFLMKCWRQPAAEAQQDTGESQARLTWSSPTVEKNCFGLSGFGCLCPLELKRGGRREMEIETGEMGPLTWQDRELTAVGTQEIIRDGVRKAAEDKGLCGRWFQVAVPHQMGRAARESVQVCSTQSEPFYSPGKKEMNIVREKCICVVGSLISLSLLKQVIEMRYGFHLLVRSVKYLNIWYTV